MNGLLTSKWKALALVLCLSLLAVPCVVSRALLYAVPDTVPDAGVDGGAVQDAKPVFLEQRIEGWTVYVNQAALKEHARLMHKVLVHLKQQLYQITRVVPPKALEKLKEIPVWVEIETKTACMAYHPARRWLLDHGYAPPDVPSVVELGNGKNFLSWTRQQPWMLLHEMAHGYNHLFLSRGRGYEHDELKTAFERMVKKKIYEEVLHWNGGNTRHYALTNTMEYFAESTEAYFGTNDMYPFVRAELEAEDPYMVRLLEKLWEVPKGKGLSPEGSPWYSGRYEGCDTGMEHDRGDRGSRNGPLRYEPTERYGAHQVEGWTVRLGPAVEAKRDLARDVLRLLEHRLHLVIRALPAAAIEKLQKVEIWVEQKSREVLYTAYHTNAAWLEKRGMNPDKVHAIEIGDASRFLAWADLQPSLLLHLMAHAYYHGILGENRRLLREFYQSSRFHRDAYGSALRFDGKKDRHPALLGEVEYFAESTEAYFGTNDYYPFVRAELKFHDPSAVSLVETLWGIQP